MSIYTVCLVVALIIAGPAVFTAWLLYLFFQLDWAVRHSRRYSVCPACHRIIRLTVFQCDTCGRANELIPVEKEVFYKRCSCGKRLPKLPRNGRDELIALCPYHQPCFPVGRHSGQYPDVLIPIVGGTSTGKSAFLAAWTIYAQGQLAYQYGVDVTFPFPGGSEYAAHCNQRFQQGIPPAKTSVTNPNGLGMDIVSRTTQKGIRVYLYDPAGEVFDPMRKESESSLVPFEYYDFMDGAVFVIDPFSIPEVQKKYPHSLLDEYGIQASDKRASDSCEKFIRGLYAHNLAIDEYHYASCAVVITKADAFDLDSRVGKAAAQKRMAADPGLGFEDALDEACSMQLKAWGLGHVLELLESHFKEVRCFSVSAFGHSPKPGVSFAPQRIELPILWLLNKKKPKVLISRR
ncbi:MAG: hypothetical protein FWC50_09070 [Planctomycetaceae bacterium]|nr:hypothetical protein [Planctomycetaceae bacterium]